MIHRHETNPPTSVFPLMVRSFPIRKERPRARILHARSAIASLLIRRADEPTRRAVTRRGVENAGDPSTSVEIARWAADVIAIFKGDLHVTDDFETRTLGTFCGDDRLPEIGATSD